MNQTVVPTLAILGAGSWGTALALLLCRNGYRVRLWDHAPEQLLALGRDGENRRYLPGFPLPPTLQPVAELADALEGVSELLAVIPSHAFAEVLHRLPDQLPEGLGITWATSRAKLGPETTARSRGPRISSAT